GAAGLRLHPAGRSGAGWWHHRPDEVLLVDPDERRRTRSFPGGVLVAHSDALELPPRLADRAGGRVGVPGEEAAPGRLLAVRGGEDRQLPGARGLRTQLHREADAVEARIEGDRLGQGQAGG